MSFAPFLASSRVAIEFPSGAPVRTVRKSEVLKLAEVGDFAGYMAERIPTYYRDPEKIAADISDGYFLKAIASTLDRLPTAKNFQDSHFGELLAAEFAVAAMDLRLLYSKLRLLTAENSNAYKMDVLLYDRTTDPVEIVLLEVKSSLKGLDSLPAKHHESIFADLFQSLNKFKPADLEYDLTAARDRLDSLPPEDKQRVRASLVSYGGPPIRHAGFCAIDICTYTDDEARVLATRKNSKTFDVDLVCVAEFAQIVDASFAKLQAVKDAAC